jgi:hypothetical protein
MEKQGDNLIVHLWWHDKVIARFSYKSDHTDYEKLQKLLTTKKSVVCEIHAELHIFTGRKSWEKKLTEEKRS